MNYYCTVRGIDLNVEHVVHCFMSLLTSQDINVHGCPHVSGIVVR